VRLHDRSALDSLRTAAAIAGRHLEPRQPSAAANG